MVQNLQASFHFFFILFVILMDIVVFESGVYFIEGFTHFWASIHEHQENDTLHVQPLLSAFISYVFYLFWV